MSDITQESIREIVRFEVREALHGVRTELVRLEAKVDSKPSLMAMFTAILVTVFGMAGVIASTVATLNVLGFIRVHP
jgi:uncharacterized membrane protein